MNNMAHHNITKREPSGQIRRWDPFRELRDMQYDMRRLVNQFFGGDFSSPDIAYGEWMPLVESYRKGNDLIFKCELPGVDPKDVDVSYDENTNQLIIKGERKAEKDMKEEDIIYREPAYGGFDRRFTLPEGVKSDQLKAKFTNGILEISVPVPEAAKPKKIEIESKPEQAEKGIKKAA